MRLPVTVKNTDKAGKVMDGWYVRIGKKARLFTRADWARDGLGWVAAQMTGESPASPDSAHGKNASKSKMSEEQK